MGSYYKKYNLVWHKNKFKESLMEGIVKLVVINKHKAGFFHIKFKKKFGYLNTIQLSKEVTGRGIGTKLMKDIHNIVKQRRKKIQLSVFEDNPIRNLYHRLGYKEIGRDDKKIVMEKRLR